LESIVSGPFPEKPGKDTFEGFEEGSNNTSVEVVVSSNFAFLVSVSGEPFFGSTNNSLTSQSLDVEELFVDKFFESNHLTCFFINLNDFNSDVD